MSDLPDKAYLSERLRAFMEGATAYELVLDRLRVFVSEQKFLIGVRLLAGSIDYSRAGKAFSFGQYEVSSSVVEGPQIALYSEPNPKDRFSARFWKLLPSRGHVIPFCAIRWSQVCRPQVHLYASLKRLLPTSVTV